MLFGMPKNKNLKSMVNDLFAGADIVMEDAPARIDYYGLSGDLFRGTAVDLKQDNIVDWVAQGRIDGGIVGLDCAEEFNAAAVSAGENTVEVIEFFDIANCDLNISVPEGSDIQSPQDLQGKRIATSYPCILKGFLNSRGVEAAEIVEMNGSVEAAIGLGMADAVLDVVETGRSLKANGLKSVFNVMPSQAVMIVPTASVRARTGRGVDGVMALSRQLAMPPAARAARTASVA